MGRAEFGGTAHRSLRGLNEVSGGSRDIDDVPRSIIKCQASCSLLLSVRSRDAMLSERVWKERQSRWRVST